MKLGERKEKSKDFLFVVDSRREGEEWVGATEYLMTKANVDLFLNKYGNVKLQINNPFQPAVNNQALICKFLIV